VGSSFTCYRGHGFWSNDATIGLWLYLIAQEVQRLDNPPEWLRVAAKEWHLQATMEITGCVSAQLDEYASTPERAEVVLEVSEFALAGLRGRTDNLSKGWLNSLDLGGPGSIFMEDLPVEVFTPIGEAFIRLLRGEITWDAATAPLVSREWAEQGAPADGGRDTASP
jgi:hypothetical protein